VLLFGTRSADYIRASGHSGCIATEVILQAKQAEYMAAPERFAEMPDFSLAPRAPSIHGTSVWTGRAVQAGFDDLEIIGLAHLYSAH
jgi:hypothetical protein